MALFCGIFGTKHLPNWAFSIKWISGFRYSFDVLVINEFRNASFCLPKLPHICPITGLAVMKKIPVEYATEWDIWKNLLLLAMLTFILFLLTYIQLCRIKTTR